MKKQFYSSKRWGNSEYPGLNFQFDPQWTLTNEQKSLQQQLIHLCKTTLRPNAIQSDKSYLYPRENLQALAKMGLLGLIIPKGIFDQPMIYT